MGFVSFTKKWNDDFKKKFKNAEAPKKCFFQVHFTHLVISFEVRLLAESTRLSLESALKNKMYSVIPKK
jgi:hypothetical protein